MDQRIETNRDEIPDNSQNNENIIRDFSEQFARLLLDHAMLNVQKRKSETSYADSLNAKPFK